MYDALTISAIVDELNTLLVGGRIQQIAHVDPLTIALEVYAYQHRRWFVLSADHVRARALLHDDRVGVDPERITPFLLLLRKYARGGRIVSVSQPRFERIISVSIAKGIVPHNADEPDDDEDGPTGDPVYSELVVEIMGRRSNVMLLEESGRIRESIKRVTPDMSRVRVVLPGRQYAPPPPQDKLEPQHTSINDLLREAVLADERLDRWLVGRYQAVSPVLSREVAYRAGLDPHTRVRNLQADDAGRVVAGLDQLFEPMDSGAWNPIAYTLPAGQALASPIRLLSVEAVEGMSARPHRSMSAAVIDALAHATESASDAAGRHAARRERLVAEVTEARDRAAQRVRSLEEQQALAEDADSWRAMGEAIYAATGSIRQGDAEFTTHAGSIVRLDPALSPSENATHYFERYRKARTATENVPALIEAAGVQLAYLNQMLLMSRQAESFDEIESVRHEWLAWQRDAHGTGDERTPKGKRQSAARRPRSFRTERGDIIWIGRTGPQNEHVTFGIAGPADLWLHARNMPGAHVILRWNGPEDDRLLEQAASLAAWYSDGRGSTTAPVDVTERRYVRKLRGAGPGMVTYRNERTLNVRPRSERDNALVAG